jgi:regulator of sigma E protease
VWKRIVVISAGPAVNFVIAFVILATFFTFRGWPDENAPPLVSQVQPGSPATTVLQEGDRIVAVDGKRGSPDDLRRQIGTHKCAGRQVDGCKAAKPAELTIVRDGRERIVSVFPRYDAKEKRPLIGFTFELPFVKDPGVPDASAKAVDTMWYVTSESVSVIGRIFFSAQARDQVSGVVGSYETTRRSFQVDFGGAMFILGLISLSLAVVNLFPFLPLDGGHIFWALAEKVRGRAIPFSIMERASVIGIMLVLILFFIGLENDLYRISNDQLGVR